ncbi:MAG: hypothetical protein HDT22_03235 [Ruminococcus sp.]|nr:hypothetical protein [Ruminococcus sp.]
MKEMKKANLIYAIKEGSLVYIDDVEKGLRCGCICPACGASLIAKKGNKVSHHFAHYSSEDCEKGYETSLHLLAKKILSETKEIMLPAVRIQLANVYIPMWNQGKIQIDYVELEKKNGEIIPDVIAYSGNKKLIIEIYVTHKVDEEKLKKIRASDISALEIDLSKFDRFITESELRNILVNSDSYKSWLYNSISEKYFKVFCSVSKRRWVSGYAGRIYYCPLARKTWYGKPYADFIDDCSCCEYLIEVETDDDYNTSILCLGRIASYVKNNLEKNLLYIINKKAIPNWKKI